MERCTRRSIDLLCCQATEGCNLIGKEKKHSLHLVWMLNFLQMELKIFIFTWTKVPQTRWTVSKKIKKEKYVIFKPQICCQHDTFWWQIAEGSPIPLGNTCLYFASHPRVFLKSNRKPKFQTFEFKWFELSCKSFFLLGMSPIRRKTAPRDLSKVWMQLFSSRWRHFTVKTLSVRFWSLI